MLNYLNSIRPEAKISDTLRYVEMLLYQPISMHQESVGNAYAGRITGPGPRCSGPNLNCLIKQTHAATYVLRTVMLILELSPSFPYPANVCTI